MPRPIGYEQLIPLDMINLMIQHNISIDSYCRTEDNHTRCDKKGCSRSPSKNTRFVCLCACVRLCVCGGWEGDNMRGCPLAMLLKNL